MCVSCTVVIPWEENKLKFRPTIFPYWHYNPFPLYLRLFFKRHSCKSCQQIHLLGWLTNRLNLNGHHDLRVSSSSKPFLDRIKLENEMRSSYSSYPATTRITTVHAEPNELILLFGFPILKQQKLQLKLRNPGTPYTSHWAESRNCGVNAHQIRIILRDLSYLLNFSQFHPQNETMYKETQNYRYGPRLALCLFQVTSVEHNISIVSINDWNDVP